ncbi:TPA: hypothetical protein DIV55_04340 [Patescibacteria group bacterium]|nr:hypothetical protein [Patescibacteria group bacterium]
MTQSNLNLIKQKAVPILKEAGVTRSALFGSYVRGDHTSESDIDLLVDVPRGTTLFDIVELQTRLEETLQKKVDLVTYRSIHPRLRESILKHQVQIL